MGQQYASQQITFGQAFQLTVAHAWQVVPAGPLISGAKVRLSTASPFVPSSQATIAGLETGEADFSGYAAGGVALTVQPPVLLSTGCVGSVNPISFIATVTSPFVANTITGYWVDDGTNVILMEALPNPIVISVPYDYLELILSIPAQLVQATT